MTPTARTLKVLRDGGCYATHEETWDHYRKRRRDLLGFIDILCLSGPYTVGIQATTSGNVSARVKKICNERAKPARAWLEAGNIIEVWGWKKYAKPINGKWWRPRIVPVTRFDLGLGHSMVNAKLIDRDLRVVMVLAAGGVKDPEKLASAAKLHPERNAGAVDFCRRLLADIDETVDTKYKVFCENCQRWLTCVPCVDCNKGKNLPLRFQVRGPEWEKDKKRIDAAKKAKKV